MDSIRNRLFQIAILDVVTDYNFLISCRSLGTLQDPFNAIFQMFYIILRTGMQVVVFLVQFWCYF